MTPPVRRTRLSATCDEGAAEDGGLTLPEREQAEEEGSKDGEGEAGKEDSDVERRFLGCEGGREERCEHARRPERDQNAGGATRGSEDHALGEELLDEASAAGADGRADEHLPAAADHAAEEEIGHVGAGDEQDGKNGGEEDERGFPLRGGEVAGKGNKGGLLIAGAKRDLGASLTASCWNSGCAASRVSSGGVGRWR